MSQEPVLRAVADLSALVCSTAKLVILPTSFAQQGRPTGDADCTFLVMQ
jgi:hypothetical protein